MRILLKATILLALGQSSLAQGQTIKRVDSVEIIGSKTYDAPTLKAQLQKVKEGMGVTTSIIDWDIDVNLKAFLKEHGFVKCNVIFQEVPVTATDIVVRMTVSEGPQYRLGALTFKGSSVLTQEGIAKAFDVHSGDLVNMTKIKDGIDEVKRLHQSYGFLQFMYLPEQAFDEQNRTMSLSFTFDQGKQFFISYIGVVGCQDQAEEDRIRAQILLRPKFVFSDAQLQSEIHRLEQVLGVSVKSSTDIDVKEGLVGVVFWLNPVTKK